MYVKTINITDELHARLESGEVRLRAGQWVTYPWSTRPSRWVGTTASSKSLWVVHPGPYQGEQFAALMKTRRENPNRFLTP